MSTLVIPTLAGVPHYVQRTKLDGKEYSLRIVWNQREERWYLNISDDADVLVCGGLKLVCNTPLIRFYHWDVRVPPGEIVCFDSTPDRSPPGFLDLGVEARCALIYQSTTDL